MNTKDLVSAVKDSVKNNPEFEGKEISKVVDTVLHSGTMVMGNLNDQMNVINRVAPNLPSETSDKIFQELAEAGVEQGDKVEYELTDELRDEFVYSFKLGKMYLAFTKL